MKLSYDPRWNPGRKWGRHENPPENIRLYTLINTIFGISLILCISLAFDEATLPTIYYVAKYAGIACGLLALGILIRDLAAEWKKEHRINIFSLFFAVGTCFCLVFLLFDHYFISLVV